MQKKYISLLVGVATVASLALVASPAFAKMGSGNWGMKMMGHLPQLSFQGNGQPIIGGNVTAISGNTITITNSSNAVYTIDASSAKFMERGVASASISNVAVGDNVMVQGAVNGASVTASSIMVAKKPSNATGGNPSRGFGFFKHLFGF